MFLTTSAGAFWPQKVQTLLTVSVVSPMQVQEVCQLVAVRGARLTAAAIAGMLRHLGRDDRSSPEAPKNVVAVEGAVLRKCASPFPYPLQSGSELHPCPWRDATAAGPDAPGTWSLLRVPSCASAHLFDEHFNLVVQQFQRTTHPRPRRMLKPCLQSKAPVCSSRASLGRNQSSRRLPFTTAHTCHDDNHWRQTLLSVWPGHVATSLSHSCCFDRAIRFSTNLATRFVLAEN